MNKLTIADILERKNVIKPLALTFKSEVLGGEIEIKKVSPDKISEIITEAERLGQYKTYCKLIYSCCPIFSAKELHETFKTVEPFEIVDKIYDTNMNEVYSLGNHILTIYGFLPRTDIKKVKK